MIRFIFGNNGSGKTTKIINALREDAENGIRSVLIVPEQQAVQTEQLTLRELPPYAQLTLEVTNFSRLYNLVCRKYGGLSYSYVTKPIKHLIMWQAIRTALPELDEYAENAANDKVFSRTMLDTVSELKASGVSVEKLEELLDKLDESSLLYRKLKDILRIYVCYEALICDRYSDSADDLSKLYDKLCEHDFFKDKNVYIDAFTSYTNVEHKIIERIFATANNVTVTVPLPSPDYKDISTDSIVRSYSRLKRSAEHWDKPICEILDGALLSSAPAIRYLCENLWRIKSAQGNGKFDPEGHIVMEECANAYAEAEAVASHVLELLREGASCSDIVVIVRDTEKYRGIIEPALESAGVPFYLSEKTDLCSLAPIKLILTALKIEKYNWRKEDIIAYIKTGLSGCDTRETDIFEEYINTWNISGARFTSDVDWTMNPRGFTVDEKEDAKRFTKETLRIVNKVRKEICEPLNKLFILLHAAEDIPDMCTALYEFLNDISLEEKLTELAERETLWNNTKGAEELSSCYSIIINAFADIANALKGESASTDELAVILKTVFDQTEIGTIPTSIDEVTVGSASLIRSSNPKYAFVMGLCEGEFPANVDNSGLLTKQERSIMADLDCELGADVDIRSSEELMFVKNAFATPTERLYLLTSNANLKGDKISPSLPFRRVEALFKIDKHIFDSYDLSYVCGSPKSAASHIRNISSTATKNAVKKAVSEHIPTVGELADASVTAEEIRVSPTLVRSILGDKLKISPTAFEKYVRCPFSYYATYLLSLREPASGKFAANNFGSFIHHVLEELIKFSIPSSAEQAPPTNEEIVAKTDEIIQEYIKQIVPDQSVNTKRMAHLYKNIRSLSLLLINNVIKEFSDTNFRPVFFELSTNGEDGNPAPILISLDNGATMTLKGAIDRVDMWKDGDKAYIRIVDYKTGSKAFELSDVDVGLNLQMLFYLFCVCRDPGTKLRTSAELNGDQTPIPAGIVYLSSAMNNIQLGDYALTEEQILSLAEEKFKRSGLILNEDSVVNAFSHSSSPLLLLGIKEKDGKYEGKALIDSEKFEEIEAQIIDKLTEIGNKIYSGVADCAPLNYKNSDPCKWCKLKPICRKNDFAKGGY
ncbi:MAG: hypothetical protein E7653_01575 [Ruminococcaceae bacterium]|nr:hypothetical protein [Oscillospiraceae bacterium]